MNLKRHGIAGLPAYQNGGPVSDRVRRLWEFIRREADDPSLAYTAGAMAPYTSMGADVVEVLAGLQDLPASRGKSLGRVGLGIAGLVVPGVSAAGFKAATRYRDQWRESMKSGIGRKAPAKWPGIVPEDPELNKMKAAIRRGMRLEEGTGPGELVDEDVVEELADYVSELYSREGDVDVVWRYGIEVPEHLLKAFEKAVISIEGTTPLIRELQKLSPF
jgi:hypothetical protein